jgi:hypothetical protein
MLFGSGSYKGEWQSKVRKIALHHPLLDISKDEKKFSDSIAFACSTILKIFGVTITFSIKGKDTIIFDLKTSNFLTNRLRPFEMSLMFKILRMCLVFKDSTYHISKLPDVVEISSSWFYGADLDLVNLISRCIPKDITNLTVVGEMSKIALKWEWRDYMENGKDALEVSDYEDDEDIQYNPTWFHNNSGWRNTMRMAYPENSFSVKKGLNMKVPFCAISIDRIIQREAQHLISTEEVISRLRKDWENISLVFGYEKQRLKMSFRNLTKGFSVDTRYCGIDGYKSTLNITKNHLEDMEKFHEMLSRVFEYISVESIEDKTRFDEACAFFSE